MTMGTGAKSPLYRKSQPPHRANRLSAAAAERSLEFDRFRVLLRQSLPPVRVAMTNVVGRCRNGGPSLAGDRP
jgi:hypothetical protein